MASLAYVAVLFAHVFWSIGAAWNARRCTLLAPAPLGIALCVLLGPLAATATYVASGSDEFAAVLVAFILGHVGLMISVNLLGRAVQSLGRSAAAFKPWGTLLALQMVMSMAFYKAIDMAGQGDISAEWLFQIYNWLVAGAALAFAGAGLFAWRSMVDFDAATSEYGETATRQ